MIYLRTNPDHTIHLIAEKEQPNTVPYSGEVPDDLLATFSKGKYLFMGDEIVLNSAWSQDNGEVVSLPADIPHRTLLLSAGISSLAELQDIEDLTTLSGIGTAKAEDITNYLNNQ